MGRFRAETCRYGASSWEDRVEVAADSSLHKTKIPLNRAIILARSRSSREYIWFTPGGTASLEETLQPRYCIAFQM